MQRQRSDDPITACREHVEQVRRHGRLTVILIEHIRLQLRRRAFRLARSPHRSLPAAP